MSIRALALGLLLAIALSGCGAIAGRLFVLAVQCPDPEFRAKYPNQCREYTEAPTVSTAAPVK